METARIIFNDGTEIEAEVNGTNLITDEEPEFPSDLTNITIERDGGMEVIADGKIIESFPLDNRYWFIIIQKDVPEYVEQNAANIDYIAMMTDVELL